ncbi:hypothetical protein Pelo_13342 [Pelomyxa schiedti]|nr:hypothetical protein Pelo_13342 [Pelomyxa schiedti]
MWRTRKYAELCLLGGNLECVELLDRNHKNPRSCNCGSCLYTYFCILPHTLGTGYCSFCGFFGNMCGPDKTVTFVFFTSLELHGITFFSESKWVVSGSGLPTTMGTPQITAIRSRKESATNRTKTRNSAAYNSVPAGPSMNTPGSPGASAAALSPPISPLSPSLCCSGSPCPCSPLKGSPQKKRPEARLKERMMDIFNGVQIRLPVSGSVKEYRPTRRHHNYIHLMKLIRKDSNVGRNRASRSVFLPRGARQMIVLGTKEGIRDLQNKSNTVEQIKVDYRQWELQETLIPDLYISVVVQNTATGELPFIYIENADHTTSVGELSLRVSTRKIDGTWEEQFIKVPPKWKPRHEVPKEPVYNNAQGPEEEILQPAPEMVLQSPANLTEDRNQQPEVNCCRTSLYMQPLIPQPIPSQQYVPPVIPPICPAVAMTSLETQVIEEEGHPALRDVDADETAAAPAVGMEDDLVAKSSHNNKNSSAVGAQQDWFRGGENHSVSEDALAVASPLPLPLAGDYDGVSYENEQVAVVFSAPNDDVVSASRENPNQSSDFRELYHHDEQDTIGEPNGGYRVDAPPIPAAFWDELPPIYGPLGLTNPLWHDIFLPEFLFDNDPLFPCHM